MVALGGLARGARFAEHACEVSWNNPAGGPWTTAANWTVTADLTNRLPTSSEHACMDLDGTYTATLDANQTVGSLRVGHPGNLNLQWFIT